MRHQRIGGRDARAGGNHIKTLLYLLRSAVGHVGRELAKRVDHSEAQDPTGGECRRRQKDGRDGDKAPAAPRLETSGSVDRCEGKDWSRQHRVLEVE